MKLFPTPGPSLAEIQGEDLDPIVWFPKEHTIENGTTSVVDDPGIGDKGGALVEISRFSL